MGGIVGAVTGGFLGGSSAGDTPQQTTSNGGQSSGTNNNTYLDAVAPWEPQQGHLKQVFNDAYNLYQDRIYKNQYYPGQTVAGFSPTTQQAMDLTAQRALAGTPISPLATNQMNATLNGDYLYGGRGFDAAYQAAANKILPSIDSRYAQGGRYGSGLSRQAEASALGDVFASQYGQERQNQMNAMSFAPQLAQAQQNLGYRDLAALADVGQLQDTLSQTQINENIKKWAFAREEQWKNMARYASMVNGNYGAQRSGTSSGTSNGTNTGSTTTTGFAGNEGAGILGGAMQGLQLGSMLAGLF
jgi:hypothetical protein